MRVYVRSHPCFNIFTNICNIFKWTVILFAGATADIDMGKNSGEESESKKTRLKSDYDELFGPHYTSEKKGLGALFQRR